MDSAFAQRSKLISFQTKGFLALPEIASRGQQPTLFAAKGVPVVATAEARGRRRDSCEGEDSFQQLRGRMASASIGSPRPAVALQCKAHGKGLETAIAKRRAAFTVELCSADGKRCAQGGETLTVNVTGTSVCRARVNDNEDGTYSVEYKAAASGPYQVSVLLHGAPLPHSPWKISVLMPRPDPSQCIVRGDALSRTSAREIAAFEVGFMDAFGQPTHAEELDVWVERIMPRDEAGTGSLELLMHTNAEAAALAWAREWAILRTAKHRGITADDLKAELRRLELSL